MSAHLRAGAVLSTENASGAAGGCPQSVESAVLRAFEMRRVPQEPVFCTEYLFRTVEACFLHRTLPKMRRVPQEAVHSLWSRLFCGPLKMRRVPQKAVFGTECLRKRLPCRKRGFSCTEYLFRTVEACFLHRMLPKMRRVPQEAFLSTARIFRTIGGPLRYRMPDTEASCHRSGAWRTF